MSEEEILIRAREACAKTADEADMPLTARDYRKGAHDTELKLAAVSRALRDAHRPLSEIVPVDPDLARAFQIAGTINPNDRAAIAVLAGIKRGRELGRAA